MTRDDAKVLWPIIKAWSEGKTMEFRDAPTGVWGSLSTAQFDFPASCYRIKPEPVEFWTVQYSHADRPSRCVYGSREDAELHATGFPSARVIKLREVTE